MSAWSIPDVLLRLLSTVLVVIGLQAMTSTGNAADGPCVSAPASYHQSAGARHAPLCCGTMHCCPMLPMATQPLMTTACLYETGSTARPTLRALMIVRPLYPPPKFLL